MPQDHARFRSQPPDVVETQARAIDACNDVAELRRIAKTLLTAWHLQTDMTRHFGAQALGITPPSP